MSELVQAKFAAIRMMPVVPSHLDNDADDDHTADDSLTGLYDYVQKSDVHCPWMSASQAKPPHEMSIPLWVAKIIVGLYVDGMRGLAKMFFFSK